MKSDLYTCIPSFIPFISARRMDANTSASGGAPPLNTSPIMDPAELRDIIVQQGAIIRSYQDQVEALQDQLRSASIAAPRDPPTARGESPRLALPDKFDGSADCCRGFLRQCEVFFAHQPGMYSKEETQCAFVMSLLTSRALEWASAVWDADPQIRSSFTYFAGLIREVFEYPAGGKDISLQLMELGQGSDTAADYAITYRTLAAQSGWNDTSLWAVFRAGLNPELQTELACRAEATTLSQFVTTAIRLDNLRRQHQAGASCAATICPRTRPDYPSFREEAPEPMKLGRSRLVEPAHQQQGQMRLCYHCGASGHQSSRCPERSAPAQVALIDSGVAVNLINGALVEKLRIPTFPCMPSLRITAIDSQPIGEGYLKPNPVILGFPWLRRHDPQISWHLGELAYAEFREVFSKERAAHQPWDCAIDLLPNASPPRGQVYPLLLPESKAIEEYIETALAAGHIRPSTSPVAAGFFFVALGQLRGARMFTKLDLKVRAVTDWPAPTTVWELQQFLGFAKFYKRFIRNYSSVAGPLTSLLRGKPKRLVWTDQARAAFQQLKECFTSAPILRHPDPDLPFVVEVDASSSGLGAVFSQHHGKPGKLHPCAYYSWKLTAAEANYDVGNRELLAIKAALEEWRHWLEGARHPFQFMVTCRPGSKNGKADALSRGFETASKPTLVEPILPATAILALVRWNLVEEIQRDAVDT
ncbi:hypothetical protein QTP70_012204 [Hemibagrus guttatus]|uniref:CCHC-type domain-containing protein n=1 Tax=Hemibagrus guttatus TaxID=175788 RepID=A0AAE0RHZ5_9TELE|nr:hypothetical protein QTP70_012204 [Hemibagrus guttatus]